MLFNLMLKIDWNQEVKVWITKLKSKWKFSLDAINEKNYWNSLELLLTTTTSIGINNWVLQ